MTETYSNAAGTYKTSTKKKQYSFGEALWLVWVLFFRVATNAKQPEYFTSKLIINIWAILCLAFMASYTANLAAFMIIKEEYPDLQGVLDKRLTNPYAQEPAYRFGTVKSGSTAEIVRDTQPQMFQYMRQFNLKTVAEGINAVKEQKLDAFLYDAVILNYRAGLDVGCKLRVVGSWYSMTGYGIAMPKHSKYREMIDRKILEYIHSGELERTANFWFSGSCKNKKEDANSDGLGVPQSISVFFLLSMGIIIGLIILVMHLFYTKHLMDKIKRVFIRKKITQNANKGFFQFHECDNKECQSEIDHLRVELVYFKKLFNSMKAIAHNPDPSRSFLNYNKIFLKNSNSSFKTDPKTHTFIVSMFENYIKTQMEESEQRSDFSNPLAISECENQNLINIQKSILKNSVRKNSVRFAIEDEDKLSLDWDESISMRPIQENNSLEDSSSLSSPAAEDLLNHFCSLIKKEDEKRSEDIDSVFFKKRLEFETNV